VKPRVFIGSSGASSRIAQAIHSGLEDTAECTVWTAGAFALATSTLASLQGHLHDSDFACFVFGPDDDATIKGELLKVPRDNVVYEAGLFSGHLGPDRCFVAVPKSVEVHVPTDLAGMTLGFYIDTRDDGNSDGAVLTFCNKVKERIGSFPLNVQTGSLKMRNASNVSGLYAVTWKASAGLILRTNIACLVYRRKERSPCYWSPLN
jgi:predicted nucleotide-binding protein